MKLIDHIGHYVGYCKEYGFMCSLAVTLSNIFPYSKGKGISWRFLQYKHKVLLKYLSKYYYNASKDIATPSVTETSYKDCIWTAWLQGEENAPEVIQLTLKSIRKNANGHQVIVLTNDNINSYIEIPRAIKEKHNAGSMGHAHFSDVVRMMILAKYGGLWLDATMFLNRAVDPHAFLLPFYSIGYNNMEPSRFVSNNKWVVGVMGGKQNSEYLIRISEMLNEYWTQHTTIIDYFVFDYLIAVMYQKDPIFAGIVNDLPQMDTHTTSLKKIINSKYKDNEIKELFDKGSYFYLSYKYDYKKGLPDDQETVYGHLWRSLMI